MAEDTDAELASLREENRQLRRRVKTLEGIARFLGAGPPSDGSANGGGDLVERDGLRFMVGPDETPEAAALRIRRALDEADGKLT